MGPPGQCSTQSSVMNLAMVNASKPDKHCIGPPGLYSACSWVMNLDLAKISKPLLAVIGNRSGHGERMQAWQALTGPFGSSQCLQLGYESGIGKHKQISSSCVGAPEIGFWFWGPSNRFGHGKRKQARQPLNGPERKQTSKTLNLTDLAGPWWTQACLTSSDWTRVNASMNLDIDANRLAI